MPAATKSRCSPSSPTGYCSWRRLRRAEAPRRASRYTASSHTYSTTASPGSPAFRCRTVASPRSRAPRGRSTPPPTPRRSPSAPTVARSSSPSAAPTASARSPSTTAATRTGRRRSRRRARLPMASTSQQDAVIVTEAFGGEIGGRGGLVVLARGAGRLAPVSASIGDTRSEVCWAAITNDGRFAYVTNFGDGTISSYAIGGDGSIELLEPVAASTRQWREGHPRRGDQRATGATCTRSMRTRSGCSGGRSAATAGSRPWASSRGSRPPSPGSRQASR